MNILGEAIDIQTFCRSYDDQLIVNENYLEWMFIREKEDVYDCADENEQLLDSCKVMDLASGYGYKYLGDFPNGSFFYIDLTENEQPVYQKYFEEGYEYLMLESPPF